MAQLVLQMLLDGLMALLLAITIAYCWRLNKRIQILQDSKSELAQIIRDFDQATQRATQSIGEIHKATSRIAENIQHKIDKANYLADDLQFMIEKGNKTADKMDAGISAGRNPRTAAANVSPARSNAPVREAADSAPMPRRGEPASEAARPKDTSKEAGRSMLESVLQRAAGNKAAAPDARQSVEDAANNRQKRPGARLRSKAEQELFDALKTGRGDA